MHFNSEFKDLEKVFLKPDLIVLEQLWKNDSSINDLINESKLSRKQINIVLGKLDEFGLIEVTIDNTMGDSRKVIHVRYTKSQIRNRIAKTIFADMLSDWGDEGAEALISELQRRPAVRQKIKEALFPDDS